MHVIDLLPTVVSYVLMLVLFVLLVSRKLYRQFPFFFSFLLYSLVRTPALFSVIRNYPIYFRMFWITEIGSVILALLATHEGFSREFRAFYSLTWFRFLLPLLFGAVFLYSYWLAKSHPPVQSSLLISLIVALEIGFQYLQVGIVLTTGSLIRVFKFPWSRAFWIQLGFAISSLGILFASLLRSEFGTRYAFLIRSGPSVAYIIALMIWLGAICRKEETLHPRLSLEQISEELKKYLRIFRRDV